jgi:hypothetical protein
MALDPQEVVILTDHGTMTLSSAVARAMMLPPQERDHASIIRDGEPSILDFHLIRHLATRWDGGPHCLSDSEMTTGAFYLRRAGMALDTQDDIAAFSDSTSSARLQPAARLPGDQSWGAAPWLGRLSGPQMRGDASCHSR